MEASPDGLEYTITLRPDAVWEDGRPVTADGRRLHDPQDRRPEGPGAGLQAALRGARVGRGAGRAAVPGPVLAAVRVPADGVRPPAAAGAPVRGAELPRRRRTTARRSRTGRTGSSSWKTQESIVLERNPRYAGAARALRSDRLPDRARRHDRVPDAARGRARRGRRSTSGIKQRAASDAGFAACCRLVEFYNLDYNYIALNNRSPFFSDARVRRALTMLLDRASIVRGLYRGSARVISGPWAPDSPAYDADVAPLPFDPAMAARLLDEAGWRDRNGDGIREKDGRRFEFDLLVSAGSEVGRQIDEMLASELAKVGVTARVRPMEWAAFVERIDAGDFEAASLAWSAVDPNPDPYFYWHSSQCAPAGINDGCYTNPEADALMVQARGGDGRGPPRRDLPPPAPDLLATTRPAIFVVNASQKYAFRKRVRGLTTSPLGLYGIWPGPLAWWGGSRTRPRADDPVRRRGGSCSRSRPSSASSSSSSSCCTSRPGSPGSGRRGVGAPRQRQGGRGDAPALRARPAASGAVRAVDRARRPARPRRVFRRPPPGVGADPRGASVHARPERAARSFSRSRWRSRSGSRRARSPEGALRPRLRRRAVRSVLAADVLGGAAPADALLGPAAAGCRSTASPPIRRPKASAGLRDRLAHLALPVTCLTYGTLAFVARLVRSGRRRGAGERLRPGRAGAGRVARARRSGGTRSATRSFR